MNNVIPFSKHYMSRAAIAPDGSASILGPIADYKKKDYGRLEREAIMRSPLRDKRNLLKAQYTKEELANTLLDYLDSKDGRQLSEWLYSSKESILKRVAYIGGQTLEDKVVAFTAPEMNPGIIMGNPDGIEAYVKQMSQYGITRKDAIHMALEHEILHNYQPLSLIKSGDRLEVERSNEENHVNSYLWRLSKAKGGDKQRYANMTRALMARYIALDAKKKGGYTQSDLVKYVKSLSKDYSAKDLALVFGEGVTSLIGTKNANSHKSKNETKSKYDRAA